MDFRHNTRWSWTCSETTFYSHKKSYCPFSGIHGLVLVKYYLWILMLFPMLGLICTKFFTQGQRDWLLMRNLFRFNEDTAEISQAWTARWNTFFWCQNIGCTPFGTVLWTSTDFKLCVCWKNFQCFKFHRWFLVVWLSTQNIGSKNQCTSYVAWWKVELLVVWKSFSRFVANLSFHTFQTIIFAYYNKLYQSLQLLQILHSMLM